MRITNNMMINSMMSSIATNLEKMSKKQDELATGKSISSPSDDPIAASKILKFNTDITELEQFTRNNNDAIAWMETTETAISDINKVLQRARELSVAASNGTNSVGETQKIRSEILELKKILVADANYSYAGRYVFSGYQTDKAFLKEDGSFNIDVTDLELDMYNYPLSRYDIGVGEDVEVNTHGLKIYNGLTNPTAPPGTLPSTTIPDPMLNGFVHAVSDRYVNTIDTKNIGAQINPPAVATVPGTAGVAATRAVAEATVNLAGVINGTQITVGGVTATIAGVPASPTKDQVTGAIRTAFTTAGIKADAYFSLTPPGNLVIKASAYGDLTAGASNDISITAGAITQVSQTDGAATVEASMTSQTPLPAALTGYEGKQYIITVNNSSQKITLRTTPPIATPADLAAAFQAEFDQKFKAPSPPNPANKSLITATEAGGLLTFSTAYTEPGVKPNFEVRAIVAKTGTLIQDFNNFIDALNTDNKAGMQTFLGVIDAHMNNTLTAQSDIGGRSNRLELVANRITENTIIYTRLRSSVQDADMSQVIMELKNSENVYKSSLSAGARIIQPSLVDFLR